MIRRSPLEGIALIDGLREVPFLTQLDLRLDPGDAEAREAVESVIGALPIEPNTVHGGAEAGVLWLGPDEWLVVGPPDGEMPSRRSWTMLSATHEAASRSSMCRPTGRRSSSVD